MSRMHNPPHPGEIKFGFSCGTGASKLEGAFGVACDSTSKLFELFCNCIA